MGDDDWTSAKLPTAFGGLGLRAETHKDIAVGVTEEKTEPQTGRIEANLTCRIWRRDEQEKRNFQIATEDAMEDSDGCTVAQQGQREGSAQKTVKERFARTKLVSGFSVSLSRVLVLRANHVVHGLWQRMDTIADAALLSICGNGVGSTWTDRSPGQGMPQQRAAKSGALRVQNEGMCTGGVKRHE